MKGTLSVSYVAVPSERPERVARIIQILALIANLEPDAETGFVRVPVARLANALDVDRTTVFRDLADLNARGLIDTQTRQVGPRRRERWVRLATVENAA